MGLDTPYGSSLRRWAIPGPMILVLVAASALTAVRPAMGETLGGFGLAICYTTAGVLVWRRASTLGHSERAAWHFLAIGLYLIATGVVVVGVLTEAGMVLPAFGATDAFFLGGYAMLLITFYRLARSSGEEGRDWVITILDALVGGIALFALVWTAFYHELIDSISGTPTWEQLVASTYPVLDMAVIVGLMILVIRRSHFRADPRLLFLAFGLGIQVLADFIFLYHGVGRSFVEAEPSYPLLLLAGASYVTMAALMDRTPVKREFPERDTPLWALMWPYVLAGALLATHVTRYRALNAGSDEVLLLDALLAIGGVVFLRQVLMIHRNRTRVENQRSELVASVSHELRTPLTAMVGYLTLLDENGDDFPAEARREMLSEAASQARHMARLVSDLVMLARDDQRQVPLEIRESTVSSIVTAALRGIEPGSARVEEGFDGDAQVRVDADRVQQALSNLLSNALRYGGDRVLLTGRLSGDSLTLEVHDNGHGVPTRHEAAIWERFERGAHRLNAVTPGMGIGLAIVQAIAEAHGGKAVYRRSESLGGACFAITIPGCVVRRSRTAVKA